MQRHRVPKVRQLEIRRIRLSIHRQVPQCPLVMSGRRKNPRNPFEPAQVRVLKAVVTRHGTFSRISRLPRSKLPRRMHRPHRPRIGQLSLKSNRPLRRNPGQIQVRNRNLHRQLPRLARLQHQVRPIALQVVHHQIQQGSPRPSSMFGLACISTRSRRMLEMRSRRQMNIQPLQLHLRNMKRLPRLVVQRRMKPELRQPDQRLVCPSRRRPLDIRPRNPRRPNPQPLSLRPKPFGQRHMKAVQLHARMKPFPKLLHNPRPQKRLGPVQPHSHHRGQRRQSHYQPAPNPLQPPVPAPEPRLFLRQLSLPMRRHSSPAPSTIRCGAATFKPSARLLSPLRTLRTPHHPHPPSLPLSPVPCALSPVPCPLLS